jgi:hypothetical protein
MFRKIISIGLLWVMFGGFQTNLLQAQNIDNRGVGNKSKNTQSSEKRLALVIGNSAYKNATPLPNPVNDAQDMAVILNSLGFEVLSETNQTKREMEILIRRFGEKLAGQGGVGLFFYAGHGLQVNGNNYLVPVEADIPKEDEVEYQTVNLSFLLGKMASSGNNLNIVILDACRNNPFARSWRNFRDTGDARGLAKVTPPAGTIMLYATQPGNVASDGTGRNGLFTGSLLEQIKKPNIELDAMVKSLARDVSRKSSGKQLPWKEGITLGDFYFAATGSLLAPVRFTFHYNFGNNPGTHIWERIAPTSWTETYPGGEAAYMEEIGRLVVEGDNGTLLRNKKDARYEYFIPDKGSRVMFLRIRLQNGDWSFLGEMKEIQ